MSDTKVLLFTAVVAVLLVGPVPGLFPPANAITSSAVSPMELGGTLTRASYANIAKPGSTPAVLQAEMDMLMSANPSSIRIDIGYDAWLGNNAAVKAEVSSLVDQVKASGKSLVIADASAERYRSGGQIPWSQFKAAWLQRVETLASTFHPDYYIVVKEPGWYAPMISDVTTNPLTQSATEWLGLTRNLSDAVVSASPNTKVGVAIAADSLNQGRSSFYVAYLVGCYQIPSLSFVGFDTYTPSGQSSTQSFLAQNGHGGKAIWIAEAWSTDGAPAHDPTRAQIDATWMNSIYKFSVSIGAGALFPFYTDNFADYTLFSQTDPATIVSLYSKRQPAFYVFQGLAFQSLSKVPRGILAYIPILLKNSQAVATARNYDQMLVVNSSIYAVFEAAGLQNVRFYTATGAIIPSWLESGNSRSSHSTIYWLKIPKNIPALGSLTIFMGFGSLSTNFFGPFYSYTGEAPQLSSTYGQYDNGKRVFTFYDNFKARTSNGAWSANLTGGGNFSRNNGLVVNFGAAPGYFVSRRSFGPGTVFDTSVVSLGPTNNLGYIRIPGALHNDGNGRPNWAGAYIRADCGRVYPDQWNKTGEANPCGNKNGFFSAGNASPRGVYSVEALSPQTSKQSINYSVGNTTQPVEGKYPNFPTRIGFTNQGNSLAIQWARVRLDAPKGVMPTVVFGPPRAVITIAHGASLQTTAQSFAPLSLNVPPGTTVTWVNKDGATHTVKSDSFAFDSGSLSPSGSFYFTFAKAGAYQYHCGFHPWMQGTVVVVSG